MSNSTTGEMHWTIPDLVVQASRGVTLRPGDLFGSGTVRGGCLLELGASTQGWLQPGDEVELEIERLGRLRSRISEPAASVVSPDR